MAVFRPSLSNYDVEKVSSAHRAVNRMEYQVEVPHLAHNRLSILVVAYPKAVPEALHPGIFFAAPLSLGDFTRPRSDGARHECSFKMM
jgi:hypothetical protein